MNRKLARVIVQDQYPPPAAAENSVLPALTRWDERPIISLYRPRRRSPTSWRC